MATEDDEPKNPNIPPSNETNAPDDEPKNPNVPEPAAPAANQPDPQEQSPHEGKAPEHEGKAKNYKPLTRRIDLMYDSEFMEERVNGQIAYFEGKSGRSKRTFRYYRRWEFYISASVPVMISFIDVGSNLGLEGDNAKYMRASLQILAAIGGIITVILGKVLELNQYHEEWVKNRSVAEQLLHEKYMYLTRTEPYDEDDAFPRFVKKIEYILADERDKFVQLQEQQKKQQQEDKEEEDDNDKSSTTAVPGSVGTTGFGTTP